MTSVGGGSRERLEFILHGEEEHASKAGGPLVAQANYLVQQIRDE